MGWCRSVRVISKCSEGCEGVLTLKETRAFKRRAGSPLDFNYDILET